MAKKSLREILFQDFSFGEGAQKPRTKNLYRKTAYFAAILTGFAALCGQVVWQKYLSVLVGSEARSTTLVVAVFLFGLALGYWAFGLLTKKREWPRFLLLKLYGYVEIATALYFGVFYLYFPVLKAISFNSPPLFLMDVLIALLALLPPTFLMGASIPLLTATLSETPEEVSSVHAKVYGWNTLGACLGVLVSAFYFLPAFGLDLTLAIAAALNFLAALVFIGNYLEGNVQKPAPPPPVESAAPNSFYLAFAFLTGAIAISLEILLVRVLNLSLGAGVYNFPMVLSLFIGGMALGSLFINKSKISAAYLIRQLLGAILAALILFGTAPYWSIWISHIRVSLAAIPSNYMVFKALALALLALFLLPAAFFMGRFLPLTYALLKKGKNDYGAVCGRLYCLNTLGTVFGAIAGGYLALYFLDLDQLFKITVYILIFLTFALILYEKRNLSLAALAALSLVFISLPPRWDRTGHYIGYFRIKNHSKEMHFKKLFFLPKSAMSGKTEIGYFKDGPNTTVTLLNHIKDEKAAKKTDLLFPTKPNERISSYSIIVNGKSDGNTMGDFSTMFLSSSLPYLFLPKEAPAAGFSAAVIGLGTGISAGVLGQLKDVGDVTVLEISPKVIKAIKQTPPALNFRAVRNPKIKVLETDAFKHFTRNSKKFDLIVSEPTNPWTAGVENLFALEFYQLASQSLASRGIFTQWLQTYDIDEKSIMMILSNLKKVFPYVELYLIGHRDLAALASHSPLRPDFLEKRFEESFLKKYHKALGLFEGNDIYLARILNQEQLGWIVSYPPSHAHTISQPRLSYRADKTFFSGRYSDPFRLAPEFLLDSPQPKRIKAFEKYLKLRGKRFGWSAPPQKISKGSALKSKPAKEPEQCSHPSGGFNFLCAYLKSASAKRSVFQNPKAGYQQRFNNYISLENQGLIAADENFLNSFFQKMTEDKSLLSRFLFPYITQRLRRQRYGRIQKDLSLLREKDLIDEKLLESAEKHIDGIKKIQTQWLNPKKRAERIF